MDDRPPLLQGLGRYFREPLATRERKSIAGLGRVIHGVTDSAPSAGEFASGVKSYNTSINVAADGRFVPTLFNQLQAEKGWKRSGPSRGVPFCHTSPAAIVRSHTSIATTTRTWLLEKCSALSRHRPEQMGKGPLLPGLDVVIGTGFGIESPAAKTRKSQGRM